ncbi:Z1 domain-containing protein [Trueperella abortisuis]|uniref:Z1 domain-containing protein n=1 Tax=Trueperella abortisuis TaxID=445930 RepID=UPI0028935776|nr:Z1 domain-containing protein [Trueperella abortisuis]
MTMTRNEFIDQIDNAVRQHFADSDVVPNEDEVRDMYEHLYDAFSGVPTYAGMTGNRDEIVKILVQKYCSELSITKKFGFAFKDDDVKPWLNEAEDEIESRTHWFYWNRYKKYLMRDKKWARSTVRTIEKDTWNILDLMANPTVEAGFERRGLVVASVQSGKTANYIGLICRAADAGYKIIIVMAGVHNVLRNQTQARLEDGFTGFNIVEQKSIEAVGVGKDNSSRRPIACTSREADFNKKRASALKGIQTAHTNEPWLFVIKKNSNSLKQVYEWLRDNAQPDDQLLLIDDEADNASINGKYKREKREDEPTRINGQIRNILNYFTRKCYVGYTATPYANILIDPTVDTDEFGKDLFPSSFIYTLEESSDYFGAEKVFGDFDNPNPKHLRFIDDIDLILPPKHKSDYQVDAIPESLKDAVRTFLLVTTIRALRGDGDEHSTMMINVSPYKQPQKSVAWEVDDYLKQLKNAIKAYGSLDPQQALSVSEDLQFIHGTWISEYSRSPEFSWEQIQPALYATVRSIHVVSINTDSTESLEYDLHTEHVIAVGGYRLSRGLTLEGLVVSYYSRNAKAYDALMQMARWFGYRPGYEDLCHIWMSEKVAGWYKFVADSTADLFDELRNMRQVQRTPKNYGLRIRQSPDSLIVTARNKMGTGTKLPAPIDLNNGFVETIAFDRRGEAVAENRRAVEQLLSAIAHYRDIDDVDVFYRQVPPKFVIDFIRLYVNEDARSPKSQRKPVLNYIDDRMLDGELGEWDVLVAKGAGDAVQLSSNVIVEREIRYPGSDTSAGCLVVGEKHRLASRGVEKKGLTEEQEQAAVDDFHRDHPDKTNTSDRYYRSKRTYPLLIIHPVLMRYTDSQRDRRIQKGVNKPEAGDWPSWDYEEEAFGWSISFPHTDRQTKPVEYVFNQVAIDNITADYDEDSDDDFEDD